MTFIKSISLQDDIAVKLKDLDNVSYLVNKLLREHFDKLHRIYTADTVLDEIKQEQLKEESEEHKREAKREVIKQTAAPFIAQVALRSPTNDELNEYAVRFMSRNEKLLTAMDFGEELKLRDEAKNGNNGTKE